MGHPQHTVAIFAPVLSLTVTVEAGREGDPDEVHFHPGGQGFWIARMLRLLDERPLLCSPIGGETGSVIRGLIRNWGIDMSPVETTVASPVTVQDRRSGERVPIAETPPPHLDRHTVDDAYGKFLDHAIAAGTAVIVGQIGEIVPDDFYSRLGHDLASSEVKVIGDLHGPELAALLDGGPIEMLKVSDEDLAKDGVLDIGAGRDAAIASIARLKSDGARRVVVSMSDHTALADFDGTTYQAVPPEMVAADFRGAGDSMTAALASAARTGLDAEASLRLACGAGAANVTRHGLGSAEPDLIHALAEKVEIQNLEAEKK